MFFLRFLCECVLLIGSINCWSNHNSIQRFYMVFGFITKVLLKRKETKRALNHCVCVCVCAKKAIFYILSCELFYYHIIILNILSWQTMTEQRREPLSNSIVQLRTKQVIQYRYGIKTIFSPHWFRLQTSHAIILWNWKIHIWNEVTDVFDICIWSVHMHIIRAYGRYDSGRQIWRISQFRHMTELINVNLAMHVVVSMFRF